MNWLKERPARQRRRLTRSSRRGPWKEVGVANGNDDNEPKTDEIPHVPHRKLGTMVVLVNGQEVLVPNPNNWSPCPCNDYTENHT